MKRNLSRGEKRLLGISGTVILGLVVAGWTRTALDAEPKWDIPNPQPTPNPNGYDLYVAAANAIIPARPAVDAVNDTQRLTDPKQIATQYSLARRDAWIAQNGQAWALFERAKAAESMHPPERGYQTAGFSSYGKLRSLARCKVIEANTAKLRGDWNGAAAHGLDIIEMGGDVARGAPVLGLLVSEAMEGIGEKTFQDTPSHLNAKEARTATKRLENLMARRESLENVLREEKWEGLSRLRVILGTPTWRRSGDWSPDAALLDKLKSHFLSKREVVDSYTRTADWDIESARHPYLPTPVVPPEADNLVNRLLNPQNKLVRFASARSDMGLSLVLLRLALRAYRASTGAYPVTLNELTPTYLSHIPLDPFGNNTPLRYRKQGDSYLIWSIGPDGKDDNGRPIPPIGNRKIAALSPDSQGDAIGFPDWK